MESFSLEIEHVKQEERIEEYVEFFMEINSTMRIQFDNLVSFKIFEEEMTKQENYIKFYHISQ